MSTPSAEPPLGRRRLHAVAQRCRIGGFQPERWLVCRCGWTTQRHYSAKQVAEWFKRRSEAACTGQWAWAYTDGTHRKYRPW